MSTYQKIRSDKICKNDTGGLQSAHLQDIVQRWINDQKFSDPYIRWVSFPLMVVMFSREQLDIINIKYDIAGIDATGTIVFPPNGIRCKRILYYAITLNKDGRIIVVAESVQADHETSTIEIFLKLFQQFAIKEKYRWPIFKVMVTDWCWALINALLKEWNLMRALDYLILAYNCLTLKTSFTEDEIVIHSCIGHLQHRLKKNLKNKFLKLFENKNLILECMGVLIKCRTIEKMVEAYENFMHILVERKK